MRRVEVARHAAEGRGRAHRRGVLLREAQVLEHQVGAEAAGVALRGRGAVHHAGHRVVLFEGPVAARTAPHDLGQHLRVQPVGHAQRERLGGADHEDAEQHVVADLGGLAGAGAARVEDVGAHLLEHGAGALQVLFAAADHEGQRAGDGAAGAARHRRIDHRDAALRGRIGDLARGGRGDGAAVDHQRARRDASSSPGLPSAPR